MSYDLPAMIARQSNRRGVVTFPEIEVTRALERELYVIARQMVEHWRDGIRNGLMPLYAQEMEVLNLLRDQAPDSLSAEIAAISEGARRLVVTLNQRLSSWVVRIERWHRGKWISGVRVATGQTVEGLVANLSAHDEVRAFQEWASGLIRGLSDDLRRRVEAETFQGIAQNRSRREVGKKLTEALQMARRRAEFIAIDQSNKISGKMDELRSREAGIDRYRWRTARDDRVRPTHRAKEGRIFKWSDPPADTGHPKSAPRCRCNAQPYVDLLEEVDPSRDFEGQVIAA